MQTLIDPFELASTPARAPARDVAKTLLDIDIELAEDADVELREPSRPSTPDVRSPDSSARLRCWCSEED